MLDMRAYKRDIGWAKSGVKDTKLRVKFDQPLEKEIEEFINKNLTINPYKDTIFILFRDLFVYEDFNYSTDHSIVDYSYEVIYEKDNSFYHILESTSSKHRKGYDATKFHDDNIVRAIKSVFKKLDKIDLSRIESFRKSISVNDIKNNRSNIKKYNYPMLSEKLNDGLYTDYYQFKYNLPLLKKHTFSPVSRKGEVWKGTKSYFPYDKDGSKISKLWGYTKDGVTYIKFQNDYFAIEIDKDKSEIHFDGYGFIDKRMMKDQVAHLPIKVNNANGFNSSFSNQYHTRSGRYQENVMSAKYISKRTKQRYSVDPFTGKILNRNDSIAREVSDTASLVIYRMDKKKEIENIDLYYQDRLAKSLKNIDNYQLTFDLNNTPISLYFNGDPQNPIVIEFDVPETKYYQLYTDKSTGMILLKSMDKERGSYYFEITKKYRAKNN